eukprot:2368072-Rhodomonas_salina.10
MSAMCCPVLREEEGVWAVSVSSMPGSDKVYLPGHVPRRAQRGRGAACRRGFMVLPSFPLAMRGTDIGGVVTRRGSEAFRCSTCRLRGELRYQPTHAQCNVRYSGSACAMPAADVS